MEKGGSTHIEIVLSFIFFIAATSAAFYLFNPIKSEKASLDADYLLEKIANNLSEDMFLYTIVINNSDFQAEGKTLKVNLTIPLDNLNVSVTNYSGYPLPSKVDSNFTYFTWESDFGESLLLKASKTITSPNIDTSLQMDPAIDNYYSISSWRLIRAISEDKTIGIISRYNTQYSSFKGEIGLPESLDFNFNLSVKGITPISWKEPPAGVQVASQKRSFQYSGLDGSLSLAQVEVKTW